VREHLLVERRADLLVDLARHVRHALAASPGAAVSFLESWLDARTLAMLVGSLRADEAEIPAPLAEISTLPRATLDRLIDLLTEEGGPRAPSCAGWSWACRHARDDRRPRCRGRGSPAVTLLRLGRRGPCGDPACCDRGGEGRPGAAARRSATSRALPSPNGAGSTTSSCHGTSGAVATLPVMAARAARASSRLRAHVEKHARGSWWPGGGRREGLATPRAPGPRHAPGSGSARGRGLPRQAGQVQAGPPVQRVAPMACARSRDRRPRLLQFAAHGKLGCGRLRPARGAGRTVRG
jgi:hypothetical protein